MELWKLISILGLAGVVNTATAGWLYYRYEMQGPNYWCVGTGTLTGGVAMLALRTLVPDFVSIVIGNGLVMAGYGLVWLGMRLFMGKKNSSVQWAILWGVVFFALAGSHFFSSIWPSLGGRLQVMSAGIFLFSVMIGGNLQTARYGNLAFTLVGGAYSLNGLINVVRSMLVLISPSMQDLLTSWAFMKSFFAFSIVFTVFVTAGQVAMVLGEYESEDNSRE